VSSDRRPIYAGRIVDLGLERARLPDGREVELEIIRHPGAAAVVPLHDDGTVTLVHQHRHAAGGMIYEIPAGVLEPGEPPAACAARELREEVGLVAGRLELLTPLMTTPGFTDETIWIYLGGALTSAPAAPDDDEYLRPARMPLERALTMIDAGEIVDGKSVCGLLMAWRRQRR